eukprot:TRINITY_DN23114_c0_g1_i1.p1 TRINITY_DN23114_c0_g1~~TRINITY_DN23114_c0_g1_i1.p1  ORF type:complete len:290 (-),score=-37.29 TRINITY_DN23114_c0_g1_i1:386-1255(-)
MYQYNIQVYIQHMYIIYLQDALGILFFVNSLEVQVFQNEYQVFVFKLQAQIEKLEFMYVWHLSPGLQFKSVLEFELRGLNLREENLYLQLRMQLYNTQFTCQPIRSVIFLKILGRKIYICNYQRSYIIHKLHVNQQGLQFFFLIIQIHKTFVLQKLCNTQFVCQSTRSAFFFLNNLNSQDFLVQVVRLLKFEKTRQIHHIELSTLYSFQVLFLIIIVVAINLRWCQSGQMQLFFEKILSFSFFPNFFQLTILLTIYMCDQQYYYYLSYFFVLQYYDTVSFIFAQIYFKI